MWHSYESARPGTLDDGPQARKRAEGAHARRPHADSSRVRVLRAHAFTRARLRGRLGPDDVVTCGAEGG